MDAQIEYVTITHPNMTAQWFDAAVHRAMLDGCRVIETGQPGVLFVTSGTVDNLTYRVSRTDCTCTGHEHAGRCKHRALAIAHVTLFRPIDQGVYEMPDEAA